MLRGLVLSNERELIENINTFFSNRIILNEKEQDNSSHYDIFIFDHIDEKTVNKLTQKLTKGAACVVSINSKFTIKNQYNFEEPFRLNEVFRVIGNFVDFCEKNILNIGSVGKFNPKDRYIVIEDKNVSLTEKESELLLFLYNNKGSTREEILQNIWKRDGDSDGKVLDIIIYGLRQKLKNLAIGKNLITLNNNQYILGE